MPDLPKRMKRERAFVRSLLIAWSPFIALLIAGRLIDWGKFQKATQDAAQEHMEASKRLAAVLLFLLFANDVLSFLSGLSPMSWAKKWQSTIDAEERASEMAEQVTKTTRTRWEKLPDNATADEVKAWIDSNLGRDRAEVIAANETTIAVTEGEAIAEDLLKKFGLDLEAYWVAEPDACDICKPNDGKPRAFWSRLFPSGPPSPHIGCRCHLRYAKKPRK